MREKCTKIVLNSLLCSFMFFNAAKLSAQMIVHDPTSFGLAMEQLAKTIQQIEMTIKTIENQYQQIKLAKDTIKNIDFNKIKDGFKLNEFTNFTEAMNAHLNLLNNIRGQINSNMFSVNGHSYSIADLTGLNGSGKTAGVFVKDLGKDFKNRYDKVAKAITKTLSEAEKLKIIETTGMSPESYAMKLEFDKQLREKSSELLNNALDETFEKVKESFDKQSSPILKKVLESGNTSPVEIGQATVILQKQVVDAVLQMNRDFNQLGDFFAKKALKEGQEAEALEERSKNMKNALYEQTDPRAKVVNSLEDIDLYDFQDLSDSFKGFN